MKLVYDALECIFFCITTYKEKDILKGAGFRWNPERRDGGQMIKRKIVISTKR